MFYLIKKCLNNKFYAYLKQYFSKKQKNLLLDVIKELERIDLSNITCRHLLSKKLFYIRTSTILSNISMAELPLILYLFYSLASTWFFA